MLGPITRYAIASDDGTQILVKELTSSSRRAIAPGERVRVGWDVRDSILLTGDPLQA